MAELSAAFRAMHFDALHPVARVNGRRDGALDRLIKAGPAGATLEFRIGREQRLTARGAFERAGSLLVIQSAPAGALGAVLAQHVELLGRERLLPLGVSFRHGGNVAFARGVKKRPS